MSEIRQNLATREWVIIAPGRSKKPKSVNVNITKIRASEKVYDPSCPFCPGNEAAFPQEEKFRIDGLKGAWKTRVINNKFKIFAAELCPLKPEPFLNEGIYKKLTACGEHELIIETPEHNKTIIDMSQEEIRDMIRAFLHRYQTFEKNSANLITLIFKNYGAMAGQTQIHSHTQIINSRIVPAYIRLLLNEAQRYFDEHGTCVFCDILSYELKDGQRLIYENKDYAAFVPYAAGAEHETWIMPKYHGAGLDSLNPNFASGAKQGQDSQHKMIPAKGGFNPDKHDQISGRFDQSALRADFATAKSGLKDTRIDQLANILRVVFKKFYSAIEDPDFNFVIRNAPYPLVKVPFYHWHIQLLPRVKIAGGFEQGSHIPVNTIYPEESARLLRECTIS